MPQTITLHRVVKAPPERIYRAFLEPGALTKWLPPNGFFATVEHLDARVGGSFRMSFTNFASGTRIAFGGEYLELVPNERLLYTDQFDDPNLPGVITVAVTLTPVFCGTDLHVVQSGIPDVIPAAACYLGWQDSLAALMALVETEAPG